MTSSYIGMSSPQSGTLTEYSKNKDMCISLTGLELVTMLNYLVNIYIFIRLNYASLISEMVQLIHPNDAIKALRNFVQNNRQPQKYVLQPFHTPDSAKSKIDNCFQNYN